MKWTEKEIEFIRKNYGKITNAQIAERLGVTLGSVRNQLKKHGISYKRILWTDTENEYLVLNYANSINKDIAKHLGRSVNSVEGRAFALGLKKDPAFLSQYFRENIHENTLKSAFKKGNIPVNKGVKMDSAVYEKVKGTFFKKGSIPHNTRNDGDTRIMNTKGINYIYIRISLGKWIPLHQKVWIEANGEIPKGFVVIFKDKNPLNCDISNLELISMKENMLRNSVTNYPEEIRTLIAYKRVFNRKLNKIKEVWQK